MNMGEIWSVLGKYKDALISALDLCSFLLITPQMAFIAGQILSGLLLLFLNQAFVFLITFGGVNLIVSILGIEVQGAWYNFKVVSSDIFSAQRIIVPIAMAIIYVTSQITINRIMRIQELTSTLEKASPESWKRWCFVAGVGLFIVSRLFAFTMSVNQL